MTGQGITGRNATFAATDRVFRKACELAQTPPTKRQASKWHNGYGKAFPMKNAAVLMLREVDK